MTSSTKNLLLVVVAFIGLTLGSLTAAAITPTHVDAYQADRTDVVTDAELSGLRSCENFGVYFLVENSGFWGAYQFLQSTWDAVAEKQGRPDLVGVRPDRASPEDQDAMARALFAEQGIKPWPRCGSYLIRSGEHPTGYDFDGARTVVKIGDTTTPASDHWTPVELQAPIPSFTG